MHFNADKRSLIWIICIKVQKKGNPNNRKGLARDKPPKPTKSTRRKNAKHWL